MIARRALVTSVLAALALAASGCGQPEDGGDIVTSGTTPATVPNGPGTPTTGSGSSTSSGTTSTSSTATGAAPAPGSDDAPQSEDEQKDPTATSP